jgi:hypothetical protein
MPTRFSRVYHLIVALARAEIVSGRQQMAGIEAKPQTLGFGHLFENAGKCSNLATRFLGPP